MVVVSEQRLLMSWNFAGTFLNHYLLKELSCFVTKSCY